MIKCVYVALKNNIVFDVSLIDYDAQTMNRKYKSILKKRDGVMNFTTQHFVVSGNNITKKVFNRLKDFEDNQGSLSWLVREIEKECK